MVLGPVWDATDGRRGEAALRDYARRLRQLSRQVIEVQEEERRHLARELHDEIGQQLTILRLQLDDARCEAGGRLDDAVQTVAALTEQVRTLSLNLRPSMLDDLGLVAALRWYVSRAASVATFRVEVDIDEMLPRLPPDIETLYFRVAQEAITNVMRHAGASRLSVQLQRRGIFLKLEIIDDGRGFIAARAGTGAGLLGMHERASISGAALEIQSSPGEGTHLRLSLPFDFTNSQSKSA